MNDLLAIGEVSKLLGASPSTVRRWSELHEGSLPVYRINGCHRRYKLSDVLEFAGLENENNNQSSSIICYARVSTSNQGKVSDIENGKESNLTRQIDRLKLYSLERYECADPLIYSDSGSGINFTRKSFLRLIRNILGGKHDDSTLIVEHKDRILRLGVELVGEILKAHNIKLIVTQAVESQTSEQEISEMIISFLTVVAAKQNGKRGGDALSSTFALMQRVR